MDFIHPDDIASTTAVVEERLKAGETVINFTNRYRCADGSYRWLEWVCHPMTERGIIFAIAHDITARQAMEAQLRENDAFIKAVMDNLPIGVAVNSVKPEVEFSYVNSNFPKFYGTTAKALEIPDNFWNAVYEDPAYREIMRRRVLEDCASGDPEKMVWDVTRQKNAEQELKETQAITRLGGEYDLRTERLVWTREVFRIHGMERVENPVDVDRAMEFYDPDQIPLLEEAFNAAVETGRS